ncbi:sialate O-acetylesterase [Arachidicoccus terrestris]|uniref:sialate O-acetylesterase n=1 Tax=Arachidicoccus terrestris TaxID=2875539 RepID=UPI001CC4AA5F|nr:sialate O-acetylesterase [Arachidicoccus terrestris]UAY56875.1 sialate O-acetylesterase [Arachidicoccus terrestris]
MRASICFVILLQWLLFFATAATAQIRVARIFSDNMVLQRDQPVKIWGWADSHEPVKVDFNGQHAIGMADENGRWAVLLRPMCYGGPHIMTISGTRDTIVYHNILLGDVWLCGGQSNMEFPVSGWAKVNRSKQEIAQADHPEIRLFTVGRAMNYLPAADIQSGEWNVCTPENIPSFSAVAYFFGRKLNRDLHVPVGLISANWGGTLIQDWIGWDVIGKLPAYKGFDPKDSVAIESRMQTAKMRYDSAMARDAGELNSWFQLETDTAAWQETIVPEDWSHAPWHDATGTVWYRKEISLTADQAAKGAVLDLGVIDDKDVTYVNGVRVGQTGNWYSARHYHLPAGTMKAGRNVIAVKLTNADGGGGFVKDGHSPVLVWGGKDSMPLSGRWRARPSVLSTQFNVHFKGPNTFASQLYNGMIAPLNRFSIKGVIWYQGEQNTNSYADSKQYGQLFKMLIKDWRRKRKSVFPFLWVQLANFDPGNTDDLHSHWALVREGQHQALALPNTGEAVAIDLGESKNIHPTNKQDVGYRLALSALKVAYLKDSVCSGPVLQSMKRKGRKLVLTFSEIGSGLISKGNARGVVHGFVVAGRDGGFVPADALIKHGKVLVSSRKVKRPVAVRYGWEDDPEGLNLYNKKGLPASPFRTDNGSFSGAFARK